MNDTISRRMAIDALNEYFARIGKLKKRGLTQGEKAISLDTVGVIKTLPSAEPERKLELHGDESAIEILSELRSWFSCFDEKEGLAYHALSLAIRAIKANSIVQAERKKGKWIPDTYGNIMCSECGWCAPQIMTGCLANKHLDYVKSNFCWHCGSDMRGESDG